MLDVLALGYRVMEVQVQTKHMLACINCTVEF